MLLFAESDAYICREGSCQLFPRLSMTYFGRDARSSVLNYHDNGNEFTSNLHIFTYHKLKTLIKNNT